MVLALKAVKTIKDPEAFEILADETRRKIIYLLKVKEMTVSQIASEIGLTVQAIYHHIRKMKKVGVVEVAREERVGHFIETYYRSAAEMFHLSCGETKGKRELEELTKSALEGLAKIGAISKPSAKSAKMIAKAANEIEKCCGAGKYTEKIEDMDDVGFFVKQTMLEYAALITEDDKNYEERTRRKSELRDILKSCCPSNKKSKK
ncbi:MAG: winged helix-turn-helix domain-containing protein [Candidatus Thermoplasmatota archaeon]|nr:winged helix-turn-helix domain-containing protein [Candidatus Thermoplasmatota archaeon]